MTLAKAKSLAGDLVDAGCEVIMREIKTGSGNWEVRATRVFDPPSASQVAGFATTHTVNATVAEVRFF